MGFRAALLLTFLGLAWGFFLLVFLSIDFLKFTSALNLESYHWVWGKGGNLEGGMDGISRSGSSWLSKYKHSICMLG